MKNSNDFIKWDGDSIKKAEKAYKNGYYLESIQQIHSWIECKLRELLILVGSCVFNQDGEKCDIANSISLNNVTKVLYVLKQLTQKEYQEINKLNKLRNELMHKYLHSSNEGYYEGVPKKEFDNIFNLMKKFAVKIEDRVMELCNIEYELKIVGISQNFPFEYYTDGNKFLKNDILN